MPSETFAFGFVANDETPYAITGFYDQTHTALMAVNGSYNQDDTFTLRSYYGKRQLTDEDWEQFDGIDGAAFPITDAEWTHLAELINDARGVTLPRIDVYVRD